MIMSLSKFMEHLICALADASNVDGSTTHNPFDVATGAGLIFQSGWIDYAIIRLELDNFIEVIGRSEHITIDKRFIVKITNKGLSHATEYKSKIIQGRNFPLIDEMDEIDWFALGCFLVEIDSAPNAGYLDASMISQSDPDGYDETRYVTSIKKLCNWSLIKRESNQHNLFHLTPRGVFFVINHSPTIFDFVQYSNAKEMTGEIINTLDDIWEWHENAHPVEPLHDHLHGELETIQTIPASDRTVAVDHNSPGYSDVTNTLEELKRAIESNNEYRNSNIADHERRLTDVESTLKLLENKRVNVNAMKAVAFGTLVYLIEKFAEHPIGELAKAAWDGLKALLDL